MPSHAALSLFQVIVVIRAACVAGISVFLDRTHDQLFDIVDCNVIASLDADLFAYVLGLLRLACDVDTVAARDGDHSPARDNQIGAAFTAPSIAQLVLLILPVTEVGRSVFPVRPYCRISTLPPSGSNF